MNFELIPIKRLDQCHELPLAAADLERVGHQEHTAARGSHNLQLSPAGLVGYNWWWQFSSHVGKTRRPRIRRTGDTGRRWSVGDTPLLDPKL